MSIQAPLPEMTPELQERINNLSIKHKTPLNEIMDELTKLYNTTFIQCDKSLPTPLLKFDYCIKVLTGKLEREIKYEGFDVIVVGIGSVRITKTGKKRGDLCIAIPEKDGLKLRNVSWIGEMAEQINNIQPMKGYQGVKLGRFSSGDFQADDRTTFGSPLDIGMTPMELLTELKINRCTIAESIHNLARKDNNGYYRKTDWVVIQGMIYNNNRGTYKSGNGEYALYTVMDQSLDSDFTTPEGITVPKKFTVSVNPVLMIYGRDNEVAFCGPLSVYKNNVQMEAYYIDPIHVPFGTI